MTPEEQKAEWAKDLAELKKAWETGDAEVKKAAEERIKALEGIIEELKKTIKPVDEKKINDALEGLKGDLKKMQDEAEEKKKDDEKNQVLLNAIDAKVKNIKSYTDGEKKAKSFGQVLEEALNVGENFKNLEMMVNNHKDRLKQWSMEIKAVGDVTIAGNYSGGTRALQILRPGIIQAPPRKVHIRELLPTGPVGPGTSYVYMKENGAGEGAISPVAEGNLKAQIDVDLVETSVNIETIAGWLRVTRKAMNNIPGFISFLQTRLPEKLLRIEDAQLIGGNGVSPNIKGITTSGNYTAATSIETLLIEQLIDGLAQFEDTMDRNATAILLRPLNYFNFFKTKAGGSMEYDLPKNVTFVNGVLYLSGVPVFASTGLTSGKYIIGDWEEGAMLLTQEAMRVEFFEQDGTNVRENKITVRIEETIAFPVFGSDYFVVGDVGLSSKTS